MPVWTSAASNGGWLGEELAEPLAPGEPEPAIAAPECAEGGGLRGRLPADAAPSPAVRRIIRVARRPRMQRVEVIEQPQFRLVAQIAGHPQQPVRPQPEVMGGEIVDRRVDQQNPGFHPTSLSHRAPE